MAGSNPAKKLRNIFSVFFFFFFFFHYTICLSCSYCQMVIFRIIVLIRINTGSIIDRCLPLCNNLYLLVFIHATGNAILDDPWT